MKTTFIGAGNMASSIVGGLLGNGFSRTDLTVADANPSQLATIEKAFGVATATDNCAAVQGADVLVLAVKPNIVSTVCRELGPALKSTALVISIAAGVREQDIERWLDQTLPIIRCMPNTPALLGCGASALYANASCDNSHRDIASKILSAVGVTVWVNEEAQIDIVTALSGSGPAYFFNLIECMTQSAVAMGISADTAQTLAIETAYGAASMARQRQDSPAKLRENVTSKGGTTAAALASFQHDNLADVIDRGMLAARDRAQSLADEMSKG